MRLVMKGRMTSVMSCQALFVLILYHCNVGMKEFDNDVRIARGRLITRNYCFLPAGTQSLRLPVDLASPANGVYRNAVNALLYVRCTTAPPTWHPLLSQCWQKKKKKGSVYPATYGFKFGTTLEPQF